MDIIDTALTFLLEFFTQGTLDVLLQFFAIAGWLPLIALLLFVAVNFYADYIQDKKTHDWKFVVLAIDIPQENVQTPKAVEQMFSQLAGALNNPGLKDKFRDGFKQRWFSFEIVSIEGYIQFLVWTEEQFRDLVEGAIYAQYPEVDIVEVEDYTTLAPEVFPDENYDAWIGDFSLAEHFAYPIRSYRDFEHSISKDTVLKDPMGTFLESFSRIGHGEQMWFQILIQPVNNNWKKDVIAKVKELIGEKVPSKKSPLSFLTDNPIVKEMEASFNELVNQVSGSEGGIGLGGVESSDTGSEDPNQLRFLTPGQSKIVEAMEEKIMKIGFKTKLRGVYLARKEVFKPHRGVNALVGAIQQFNIPSANSIEVKSTAGPSGKKKDNEKMVELLKAYKKRKINTGSNAFIFNIEELATIWHFPMSHVKTPLLQKTQSRSAEPPIGLPVESLPTIGQAPAGLPVDDGKKRYQTDSGDIIEFDDFG